MNKQAPSDSTAVETMDLEQLAYLLKAGFWWLGVGLLAGALAALLISEIQTPVYEAKTQLMLADAASTDQPTNISQEFNLAQNTQTYDDWLSEDWMREEVAKRLGGQIDDGQVSISSTVNSRIVEISTQAPSPARAKSIADVLVQILIEKKNALQNQRYANAEESMAAQITEIEKKIAETKASLNQAQAVALKLQTAEALSDIAATQKEIDETQAAIKALRNEGTGEAPGTGLSDKLNTLTVQQQLLAAYQARYVTLVATGKIQDPTDEISEMESSLNVDQQIRLNLLNDRQTLQLDRLQNARDVVQLNPAISSTEPVRPRVPLNTAAGGLAGLVLAVFAVLLTDPPESAGKNDRSRPRGQPVRPGRWAG